MIVVALGAVVALSGWFAYNRVFAARDYTGPGSGSILVEVHPGDGADAIGTTLLQDGVVRSKRAFTNAASHNSKASSIRPGRYKLRKQMSAKAALDLLLDPVVEKVTIPEGAIEKDVITKLAAVLGVPAATVQAATKDTANLNLPGGYSSASGDLTSGEGFLYPDTYTFDPGTTAAEALSQMISEFTNEDRSISFATKAKALGSTPYEALIIASIAQSEVKFADDAPKVARVVLNRVAADKPLQIDATSAYAAKLRGLDPVKVIYATIDSPYNSYLHAGLPPTPIGNPGESSLKAAVDPAQGNWLYYVNGDAAGHMFFTNDEAAFTAAVAQCKANHWGCG